MTCLQITVVTATVVIFQTMINLSYDVKSLVAFLSYNKMQNTASSSHKFNISHDVALHRMEVTSCDFA